MTYSYHRVAACGRLWVSHVVSTVTHRCAPPYTLVCCTSFSFTTQSLGIPSPPFSEYPRKACAWRYKSCSMTEQALGDRALPRHPQLWQLPNSRLHHPNLSTYPLFPQALNKFRCQEWSSRRASWPLSSTSSLYKTCPILPPPREQISSSPVTQLRSCLRHFMCCSVLQVFTCLFLPLNPILGNVWLWLIYVLTTWQRTWYILNTQSMFVEVIN